jgi:hypothetical protein
MSPVTPRRQEVSFGRAVAGVLLVVGRDTLVINLIGHRFLQPSRNARAPPCALTVGDLAFAYPSKA